MTKKVSSPIVPQKGKLRSVQKRPATKKTKAWQAVKYIRENVAVGPRGVRKEQAKWKRSLLQLLMASNKDIVKMLVADRILPNWKNKVCPRCEAGSLSELKLHTPAVNTSIAAHPGLATFGSTHTICTHSLLTGVERGHRVCRCRAVSS